MKHTPAKLMFGNDLKNNQIPKFVLLKMLFLNYFSAFSIEVCHFFFLTALNFHHDNVASEDSQTCTLRDLHYLTFQA